MKNIKSLVVRELSSQRTVSLYKDQEERIDYLKEKYNINIKFSQLVREGVDLILSQIENQLKEANKE